MLKKLLICFIFLVPCMLAHANQWNGKETERILSIIKPDAVKSGVIGEIISRFEKSDLKIVGIKMVHLTKPQAMQFYSVHKDKPFF